jgi:hypothetical protein
VDQGKVAILFDESGRIVGNIRMIDAVVVAEHDTAYQ